MHSLAPASSAFSTTAPARCGSRTSKLIPSWHDKHPLTCDNDTTDSWEDGRTRQPPLYQGSLHFLCNTPITTASRADRYTSSLSVTGPRYRHEIRVRSSQTDNPGTYGVIGAPPATRMTRMSHAPSWRSGGRRHRSLVTRCSLRGATLDE